MKVRAGAFARILGMGMAAAASLACEKSMGAALVDAIAEPDPAAATTGDAPAEGRGDVGRGTAPPALGARSPANAQALTRPVSGDARGHPLAEWMRGPASAAMLSGNLDAIAATFDRLAGWAPGGYANWASIASDGSQAARAGSIEGVRAACRGCHTQYETRYKATLTSRPLS